MAQPKPSAAQALYGHLPSGERPEVKQRKPNTADALFPGWSREAKAKEADKQLWDRICEHNRDVLRRGLREAVANLWEGRR
jgi:hypothetical protein